MANNSRTFIDFDLAFKVNQDSKQLFVKYDENAIKQSIKNLVMTRNYERPFHSEIGCPINSLLFEPVSPALAQLIKQVIIQTITNFEPRVSLTSVQVKFSPDNNSVYVSIEYKIINTSTLQALNLTLKRSR